MPVADALGLTKPIAHIVLRQGYEPSKELAAELQTHAAEMLAGHKVPHRIQFVQSLPIGPTGKLLRKALARTAEGATTL